MGDFEKNHVYIYLIFVFIAYFFSFERMIETRHAITFNSLSHSNLEWKRFFQFLFLLIMSVLWFISAFRDEHIGSDHGNYVDAFHNIEKNGDAYFTEKGYVLLNKIAIIIGGGTVTLTILVTTLILLNFIIYIRKICIT